MTFDSLPEQLQALRAELPAMIGLLEEQIPYASALVMQETGMTVSIDSRNERISERSPHRGVVFTLFNGRFFQEWATDILELNVLWDQVRELRRRCGEDCVGEPRFTIDPGVELDRHFVSPFEIDPDSITLTDLVAACQDLLKTVHGLDSKIVKVEVNYQDGKEHKLFINRNRHLSSSITLCVITLLVVGSRHGSTQMNFLGAGGVKGFEAIRVRKQDLQETIDDLNLLFESNRLDSGTYDVISAPEVSGILAHEAFGHGVETDMFEKSRAKAVEYLGKPVASPLVTMIDDPSLPGLMGSYFFDDEGWPAQPTAIIEGGILKRGLTDLRSATVLRLPRSSNGRRESVERKIYARMSNTFFAEGTSRFEDMLASVDQGLYLKKSFSGMEDPKGWGIQVGIHLAREIRGGKLTSKTYSPLSITGYVPDLLKSISMMSDSVGFMGSGGMCGKGHKELVRVSSGGPHLRFAARLG